MLRGHYNAAPGALKSALRGMPTHNKKVYFVSIRNLQVHVFRLDTDILNRGVSIRNLGLIATIGLPLPTIR
jgi:hypothetical protein